MVRPILPTTSSSGSAAWMPTPTLQRHELLRILALGGTVFTAGLCHTVATVLRALLGSGSHRSSKHGQRCPCRMHTNSPGMCPYRLLPSKCSACFRLVSVSVAPLNIRAISCVRSVSSIRRTSVWVLPFFSVFSIRKCWSPNAAI
jgi:hypothetical protein